MPFLLLLLLCACGLPAAALTATPAATPAPSVTPTSAITPEPGLLLRGSVRLPDGAPLEGAAIFRAYASYPGEQVAVSGADGHFQSALMPIPGDEMVRVWAELEGYALQPEAPGCDQGVCAWRHYFGFEEREINFVAENQ